MILGNIISVVMRAVQHSNKKRKIIKEGLALNQ